MDNRNTFNNNNRNSNKEEVSVLGDITKHPTLNILLISIVILIITLIKFIKNNPKLLIFIGVIFILVCSTYAIIRVYKVNTKKMIFIFFIIIIAIILVLLILQQGDFFSFSFLTGNKSSFSSSSTSTTSSTTTTSTTTSTEEESNIDDTTLKYDTIECYHNQNIQENFVPIDGPCYSDVDDYGYSIQGNCVKQSSNLDILNCKDYINQVDNCDSEKKEDTDFLGKINYIFDKKDEILELEK